MIVILAEKPVITLSIIEHHLDKLPNEDIYFIHTYGIMPFVFDLPQKIKYKEYPIVKHPKLKLVNYNFGGNITSKGYLVHKDQSILTEELNFQEKDIATILVNAKSIICACDIDVRGIYSFHTFIQYFAPKRIDESHQVIESRSLIVEQKLDFTGTTQSDFYKNILERAQVKRFFEYNFIANSVCILNRPFKAAFGDNVDFKMSKYGLQTLFHLNSMSEPVLDVKLILTFAHWIGTGKYLKNRVDLVEFASCTSRMQIINELIGIGAVTKTYSEQDGTYLRISQKGTHFLSMLHKDMIDPDLPYRIAQWQDEGAKTALPKIERYLKTYFGKQKKLNSNSY